MSLEKPKALLASVNAKRKKTEEAHRWAIVKWAKWGVANEPSIHYGQVRPMPLRGKLPLTTDCSGFATLCYKLAGCPDPNTFGYNGQGNTSTLLRYGQKIKEDQVMPGDLIVYGTEGSSYGHHVVIAVEHGPDPLCVSHGQEKGPALVKHSVEKAFQTAGCVFLRFRMVP